MKHHVEAFDRASGDPGVDDVPETCIAKFAFGPEIIEARQSNGGLVTHWVAMRNRMKIGIKCALYELRCEAKVFEVRRDYSRLALADVNYRTSVVITAPSSPGIASHVRLETPLKLQSGASRLILRGL